MAVIRGVSLVWRGRPSLLTFTLRMGLQDGRRGFFSPFVGAYPTITACLQRLEEPCQRAPVLSRHGGIYTVIAQKPARS